MKYIKQILIILAISFVGEVLHALIPAPVPAGIYGIVILFLLLQTGLLKLRSVEDVGKFLLDFMPVMFVPAAVGVLDSWGLVASSWLAYLAVLVVTTVVVMAVSGLVTQVILRKGGKKDA